MLTELRLENFKCFGPEVVIPCRGLTLLTGINGKGKSTSLQSLLLLHQAVHRGLTGSLLLDRIELNGPYVHLGAFREIHHRDRPQGEPVQIGFEISEEGGSTTTTRVWLSQEEDHARWAGIDRVDVERFDAGTGEIRELRVDGAPFVHLDFRAAHTPKDQGAPPGVAPAPSGGQLSAATSGLDRLGRVHYISADRLGPQDFFPWSSEAGFLSVGVRGERTAEVLYQAERERRTVAFEDPRGRSESETIVVTDQASAWLAYLFDGGAVRVQAPHSTILTLEMNSDGSPHYHSPVNLGFGYSYALPILVAGLVTGPGEILVVENPEAHLHPLAQSRMGEFLVAVSAAGVQVFVESHSEHILNAFRLAVKDHRIPAEDLRVLYFRRDGIEPVLGVPVEPDGSIAHWPDGFFDQRTRDFLDLFGET